MTAPATHPNHFAIIYPACLAVTPIEGFDSSAALIPYKAKTTFGGPVSLSMSTTCFESRNIADDRRRRVIRDDEQSLRLK
jgi:hypothetical protein